MAHIGIDTTQHERSAPQGGPLPPGVYTMTVVRAQQKETKKGGVQEEIEFDISLPAQFSNRKFWDRFNIVCSSPKAQKIAHEGIADLAKACGIKILNDDQELLGKTVQGRLIVKASDNPEYPEPKNECRKYYPVGVDADAEDAKKKGGAASAPAAAAAGAKPNWNNAGAQPAQAPAAAVAAPTAPWKR